MRRTAAMLVLCALGLTAWLGPPGCTWSSSCMDGRITTESIPDATVGQPYSFHLTQSCGGKDSEAWQLLDGEPPPGITLSWDGRLSGIPTTPGEFRFQVAVNLTTRGWGGVNYPAGSDSRAFTLTVRP